MINNLDEYYKAIIEEREKEIVNLCNQFLIQITSLEKTEQELSQAKELLREIHLFMCKKEQGSSNEEIQLIDKIEEFLNIEL